jgi:LacI family transcriptional regulator
LSARGSLLLSGSSHADPTTERMLALTLSARRVDRLVVSDNVGGAIKGTAHLIAGGHRRIGYLGDNPGMFTARERYRGHRSAMSAPVPAG